MLNFNGIGKEICVTEGGSNDKKKLSVSTDIVDGGFNTLTIQNSKFHQIPDKHTRSILYITGPSGSGKSTYTLNYLKQYKKMFPKNEIYLFSALKSDETIDQIKTNRIKIDESLIDDPIDIDELENSMCVFDDIDVINNKKIRESVYKTLNSILECGRHKIISCILTNHLATNSTDTKRILNEAHTITYFPFVATRATNYLLYQYCGLDKQDVKEIKKTRSRWATIFKSYPPAVMVEHSIKLLGQN